MKKNVCIIGHFGADINFRDGQTVKTRILEQALSIYASDTVRIYKVDTYYYRKNILIFILQLLIGILFCNRIILCVSKGGRRVFFPLAYWLKRILGKKVYYCAIGGRLAKEARENAKVKKYIKVFQYNWVESIALTDELKSLGVTNAEYLPNFKILQDISLEDLPMTTNCPIRFCTFSRVMEKKGITDAVQSVIQANKSGTYCTLDIYGPIDKGYEEKFLALMRLAPDLIHYRGEADPDQSVQVLNQYDMLLFPTSWYLEGMPGSIIDSLCAGLPVIARKWRYCDEMLVHGKTGFCYDFDQPQMLQEWIEYAVSNPQEIVAMRKNCLAAGEKFQARSIVPRMVQQLLEG